MPDFIEIDFIECGDTGSGDAIAIRHRHKNVDWIYVVDGGYKEDGTKLVEHIRNYYDVPYSINFVVLTHSDTDHASGLKAVLRHFNVGCLRMNRPWEHVDELMPKFKNFQDRERLVARLKRAFPHVSELEEIAHQRGIEIKDTFAGNNIGVFTVLAPSKSAYLDLIVQSEKTPAPVGKTTARFAKSESSAEWGEENLKGDSVGTNEENETSIVQFAHVCNKKVLLTGDAGVKALTEAHQVATRLNISTAELDWFHVPHHGSRRNLSSGILNTWLGEMLPRQIERPKLNAIISANRKDKDHPKKAVIRAMIHRGRRVVQTNGTLRLYTNNAPERAGWYPSIPLEYPTDQED